MIVITRFAKSLIGIIFMMLILTMLAMLHPPSRAYIDPWTGQLFGDAGVDPPSANQGQNGKPLAGVKGDVIMGKLGNATAKAALGRATWKLLHTMTLRYPENPTPDQREALSSYFHLTSRLYPCGECAAEFQALLKKYPPQTSSRRAASFWLCAVHNEVNARLKKPQFDCAHLDDEYDCGCGDAPVAKAKSPKEHSEIDEDEITGVEMIKGGR